MSVVLSTAWVTPTGTAASRPRGDHGIDLGADLDQPVLGVGEPQAVAAAAWSSGAGSEDRDDAAGGQPARRLVDLGGRGHGERDPAETHAVGPGQVQYVVARRRCRAARCAPWSDSTVSRPQTSGRSRRPG